MNPDDLARRTAARLAGEIHANLPALTEGAIVERGRAGMRGGAAFDLGSTAAIAGLIVAVAQFAWQVYRDLKADGEQKNEVPRAVTSTRELILRRIRLQLPQTHGISEPQRDRICEVVVEELLIEEQEGPWRAS